MRPAEAWEAVARTLGIEGRTGHELYAESEPLLQDRCGSSALRLPPGLAACLVCVQPN